MSHLFARTFGLLQLHSLGIGFSYTRDEMLRPHHRHGVDGVIEIEKLRWREVSELDRAIFLTDRHETEHFTTLTSTPAGVLLWRLYQVVVRDARYLTGIFDQAGIPISAEDVRRSGGLVPWCRSSGLTWLEMVGHKLKEPRLPGYVQIEVLPGLESILDLFDILTCPLPHATYGSITRGQFADLLNRTYDYLARRCDLELCGDGHSPQNWHWTAMWASRDPNAPLFSNPTDLNLRGTLELLAYAIERRTVRNADGTKRDLAEWHQRVPDEYRESLEYWLQAAEYDETRLRSVLIDGLLGRIDLAAVGSCPIWDFERSGNPELNRIYRHMQSTVPRTSDGRQILFVESEWPWARCSRTNEKFEMNCPPDVRAAVTLGAVACRRHLAGAESRWEGAGGDSSGDPEIPNLYASHLRHLNDVFLRNITYRRDHLLALLNGRQPTLSLADLSEGLLLIEYKDEVSHYNPRNLYDVYAAALFGASNAFAVQLVRGRSLPSPRKLGAKVAAYYRGLADELMGEYESASDLRNLAERIETEQHFSRARFAKGLHVTLP